MTVCNEFKKYREKHQLNQVEFGKKLGIGQSYYTKLETGKRSINDTILNSFAEISDFTFEELKTINEDANIGKTLLRDIKRLSPAGVEKIKNFVKYVIHQEGFE